MNNKNSNYNSIVTLLKTDRLQTLFKDFVNVTADESSLIPDKSLLITDDVITH